MTHFKALSLTLCMRAQSLYQHVNEGVYDQGPVVQSPISTKPGLTLNKTYGVNPGLALIGL